MVAADHLGSFTVLGLVLRAGLRIGVTYGIWGACGAALTAVLGTVIFGDPFTMTMGVGIALVIGGVLRIELGSHGARGGNGVPIIG